MNGAQRIPRVFRCTAQRERASRALVSAGGVTALILAAGPAAAAAQQTVASTPLVFDSVAVVDVEQGKLLPAQRVVVVGSRVHAIGPVDRIQAPAGARVIRAKGKYMIPGMWDMHVHVNEDNADFIFSRYIAHGITGAREMAQRFPSGADSFRVRLREILAGHRVGPRGFGPSADLTGGSGISIGTPEQAAQVIDSLKAAGDAFAKYHGGPNDPELVFALLREARRIGFPIVGHVPTSVSNVEMADSGYSGIEHVEENRQCWPNWPGSLGDSVTTDQRCGAVAAAYVRNGTWLVPSLIGDWMDPAPGHQSSSVFGDAKRMVRTYRRFGVTRFLTGTDWSPQYQEYWDPQLFPGLSAAEEIVFLADAGLTPMEALQAGTLNPARFFRATDSLGTVAAGKLADLVLLDADPLADVSNVLKVWAVVANGRYFDRAALDALDPDGTQPGTGIVARQRRFERGRSRGFAVGADTIEIALTDSLLVHFAALWKELNAFWGQHPALLDSARTYEDHPVVPVTDIPDHGNGLQITVYDYAALAAKDPALAALFKKHGIVPEAIWPLHVTLKKTALRKQNGENVASGSLAARNVAVVEAHQAELDAAGFEF